MSAFNVSKEVTILGVSLYVAGIGRSCAAVSLTVPNTPPPAFGPLFAGPLSELYGRSPVYRTSYILFFAFSWPVAFAPNIGTSSKVFVSRSS